MLISSKPLSKVVQSGKILYGVQILIDNKTGHPKQIWKCIQDYRRLQNQLQDFAFDLDSHFNKKLQKQQDQRVFATIQAFINQIKIRPDITDNLIFRQFFELEQLDCQYLSQWISLKPDESETIITDFAWDAEHMQILVASKTKNKIKKISAFFKQLLSSSEKNDGQVNLYRLNDGKWKKLATIIPQAQVLKLTWSRKAGLFHISTTIGIFIYSIQNFGDTSKHQLLDFIKIYDCRDLIYALRLGVTYYCSKNKIYVHCLQKQINMQIDTKPLPEITALALQKSQKRLYVSLQGSIKIYDVSQFKMIKCLAQIEINSRQTNYCRLYIPPSQKYLLGLNSIGFITVFQIKPSGKQRLMNALTNIDCPENSKILSFNQKNQLILTSHGKHNVFLSTKNIPIYAGGNSSQKITCGIYDDQNNIVITGDQSGLIRLYNVSMHGLKKNLDE